MPKHYKTKVKHDQLDAGFDAFKADCLSPTPHESLDERDAWAAYVGFIDRMGQGRAAFAVFRIGRLEFTERMSAAGWERQPSNGRRMWRGLRLSPAGARDLIAGRETIAAYRESGMSITGRPLRGGDR